MGQKDCHSGDQGRRAERLAVDAAARLRPNSWSSLEITMVDLSSLGFRARCDARVQPGGCVSLDVPGIGPVEAQVEWQRRDQFGARFLRPIELDRCGWTLVERQNVLAQLLVQRAAARKAGRRGAETQLRQQILGALPISKGTASA
jgi:hypothetical protein